MSQNEVDQPDEIRTSEDLMDQWERDESIDPESLSGEVFGWTITAARRPLTKTTRKWRGEMGGGRRWTTNVNP